MSAPVTLSALEELQTRAVASSADRESWLAARAPGVTATEVAKLAKGGVSARREILASKIKGDPFRGNQYTQWGSLREEAIAEDVRARTGIVSNQTLFHAKGNRRHLATPDGVGVDFDGFLQMSEIKTSKHDLMPCLGNAPFTANTISAKEHGFYFWSTRYYDQIQWQLYVCDAVLARFTWEQHNDDWSGWPERGPKPLLDELPFRIIHRDEARIAELVAIADDFLEAYDLALRDAADGVSPEIDDTLDTHAVNYLRFIGLEKEATAAKKDEWTAMLERLEGCDALTQEGATARVTYNPGEEKETEVADVEAAKLADPELFAEVAELSKRWNAHQAQFKKPSVTPAKPSLTVTAIKVKETKK